MGISALCYIYMKPIWCNSFADIYARLEEGGLICYGYMCIVLYMKLIWCNGFAEIYAQLEEGMESICHGYMCIVLYMQLIWCDDFPDIYVQLEEGWWGHLSWNWFGIVVFHASLVDWRGGSSASRSAKFGVVIFIASLLEWGSQSVIHPCYTVTPPLPIDHISMLHCYTFPLPIDHRSMLHHYTP